MFRRTLSHLRCPRRRSGAKPRVPAGSKPASARIACAGELRVRAAQASIGQGEGEDILQGELECAACSTVYPIIGGVGVVVSDVRGYLHAHVKGLGQVVDLTGPAGAGLPKSLARELKSAYAEATREAEHIEEDLESERVNALYVLNHYHDARGEAWWQGPEGAGRTSGDPLIDSLIRSHWDQGPLARISRWSESFAKGSRVVELGCGVGGLAARFGGNVSVYLGVDSSFASIALARHLALGAPYLGRLRYPGDLLEGPVSQARQPSIPPLTAQGARAPAPGTRDFVVGEIDELPVAGDAWDVNIALNAIDMLEEPGRLPDSQRELLVSGGTAIQSCPYIWHERIARKLRARLPRGPNDSAAAVEWLYEGAGLRVEARESHVPWLFFKHRRQIELYSVHLFRARKA